MRETTSTTDALGRVVVLPVLPRRVVSLVPSLTEYLFAIGAGARVVGITDFCTEPAAALAGLPRLRGPKNPDRAALLDLRPDLVLAAREENRQRDVEALAAAGAPVYVTDICTVADAVAQLGALAPLVGAEEGAAALLASLRAALAAARPAAAATGPRALVFVWREPWVAVGSDTYAADLLRLGGARNAAAALPGRYPRATLEEFMLLKPDVVLLPDEPYPFSAADIAAFVPFGDVATGGSLRVHLCDGTLLTWYGPRTVRAMQTLPRLLAGAG